jgi:hypothetical protein
MVLWDEVTNIREVISEYYILEYNRNNATVTSRNNYCLSNIMTVDLIRVMLLLLLVLKIPPLMVHLQCCSKRCTSVGLNVPIVPTTFLNQGSHDITTCY